MTRIKQLRKAFGYTQEKLAQLLHVARSTVAMWETSSQTPDYATLKRISQIFDIPPDFVLNEGIFSQWDTIIKYYQCVSNALCSKIPTTLKMPSFSGDRYLRVWLDTRLYFEPDELQLARWFNFAIQEISVVPDGEGPDGQPYADVEFSFTPEFESLVAAEQRRQPYPQERLKNQKKIYSMAELAEMVKNPKPKMPSIPYPIRVPVLGDVAAGLPMMAEENIVDYEEVDPSMAAAGDLFGLRIKGSSMEPRIKEGDVVIVRKQEDVDTGDTAVVLVNGDSATVKRIKKETNGITLVPNNTAFSPIYYSNDDIERLPVRIIGKVLELRGKL